MPLRLSIALSCHLRRLASLKEAEVTGLLDAALAVSDAGHDLRSPIVRPRLRVAERRGDMLDVQECRRRCRSRLCNAAIGDNNMPFSLLVCRLRRVYEHLMARAPASGRTSTRWKRMMSPGARGDGNISLVRANTRTPSPSGQSEDWLRPGSVMLMFITMSACRHVQSGSEFRECPAKQRLMTSLVGRVGGGG